MTTLPPLVQAQDVAVVAQRREVSIAPGGLAEVLSRFASQQGVALSFDAAVLAGRQSTGLAGAFTADEGFRRLLDGTGWQAVVTPNGSFGLRREPAVGAVGPGGATSLPQVDVMATADDAIRTEGSGAYAARGSSLFKNSQSLRDTPQSVSVITRQQMEDQSLPDLTAVLGATPGVVVDYTDSERVTYYSRGYQIDAIQFDGATVSQGSGGGSAFVQPDMAVLDRVEVLRGASGLLRGSGNPSATVNLVRKRPTRDVQSTAAVTLGSWNRRRIEADVSGGVTDGGALRARVVTVAENKDFFQHGRSEDRRTFYGIVEGDIGERTVLGVGIQYTDLNATGAWGGLPLARDGTQLGLPRDTYLSAAWNCWNRWNQQVFADLAHEFDSGWNLKLAATHTKFRLKDDGFKQTYFSRSATQLNPYLAGVSVTACDGSASDQNAFNANATGPFSFLGRKHELVLGVESIQNKSIASTCRSGVATMSNVDVRTWNPFTSMPEPFATVARRSDPTYTTQQGAYATGRFSLADPLTAIVGARVSWWDYRQPSDPGSAYGLDKEVTPYAGLVYDLTENVSAFASYTEIFSPQNHWNESGQMLPPVRGENYEVGLKGEFYDKRLNTSVSLFRINNVGAAMEDLSSRDPCLPHYEDGYCRIAGGKTRSQGVEFEAAGELAPGWQIMAGYTFTATKYLNDASGANIGQPLRRTDPRQQLRLFTTYRLGGALNRLTLGGGVQVQSRTQATSGSVVVGQGGFAVYSAMASYRLSDNFDLQINVNNLFDKVYYKKYAASGIANYYGDPLNVNVTLRRSF